MTRAQPVTLHTHHEETRRAVARHGARTTITFDLRTFGMAARDAERAQRP